MHRPFTRRTGIQIPNLSWPILLVFPNRQEFQSRSLLHHRLDMADWKLDNHSLRQLRIRFPYFRNGINVPSRFCTSSMAAPPDLLRNLPHDNGHLHLRKQVLAYRRHDMRRLYGNQYLHHHDCSLRQSRCGKT